MSGVHTTEEVQRDVVQTIEWLHERTRISRRRLLRMASIQRSRYHRWLAQSLTPQPDAEPKRSSVPQLLPEERASIIAYKEAIQRSGRHVSYRVLTYEMIDNDVAYASESTVYRVLQSAGLMQRHDAEPTKKGTGFIQPKAPHEHWHTDISYLWEFGHRRYLVSVLDGYSRAILHHSVLASMGTGDVELVMQKTVELYPEARPRLITDNGGQFVSNQFKSFLADNGFTHARTSRSYPQSNGKMERQFRTVKEELRSRSILSEEDLEQHIKEIIDDYNYRRYHAALGYVTPMAVLHGKDEQIRQDRRRKLDDAAVKRSFVHSQLFN